MRSMLSECIGCCRTVFRPMRLANVCLTVSHFSPFSCTFCHIVSIFSSFSHIAYRFIYIFCVVFFPHLFALSFFRALSRPLSLSLFLCECVSFFPASNKKKIFKFYAIETYYFLISFNSMMEFIFYFTFPYRVHITHRVLWSIELICQTLMRSIWNRYILLYSWFCFRKSKNDLIHNTIEERQHTHEEKCWRKMYDCHIVEWQCHFIMERTIYSNSPYCNAVKMNDKKMSLNGR